MKSFLVTLLLLVLVCAAVPGALAEQPNAADHPLPVKVLILPKFEIGEMAEDFPGEAQYYYQYKILNYNNPWGSWVTVLLLLAVKGCHHI